MIEAIVAITAALLLFCTVLPAMYWIAFRAVGWWDGPVIPDTIDEMWPDARS